MIDMMLLAGLGGILGTISRYYLGLYMIKLFRNSAIPFAIIVINGLGSFGLGLVLSNMELGQLMYHQLTYTYAFMSVGFLGAFTTFSTFSVEAVLLWRERRRLAAVVYIAITMIIVILGFWIGIT
jgi:CrcB protein